MTSTKTPPPITLRFDDNAQQVVIHPEDNDRFVMSASKAAKVLRMFDQLEVLEFREQFKQLLDDLAVWFHEHRAKLARGILTRRDANLLFLVCTSSPRYDADLEDALTELDLQIANDRELSSIRLSVLAIPSSNDDAVAAYADPDLYLEIKNA